MIKCSGCGRIGLLIVISTYHLCGKCKRKELPRIELNKKILRRSLTILAKSTNLKTILTRCNLILEKARDMLHFEQNGASLWEPPLTILIEDIGMRKRDCVEADIVEQFQKAKAAYSPARKLMRCRKAVEKIKLHRSQVDDRRFFDVLENEVHLYMHEIEFQKRLQAAQKAEFKQKWPKAIDGYWEALHFLKTDFIDDHWQTDKIKSLESRIKVLQKKLKSKP